MRFFELELDGELVKFRLTSSDGVAIEKKTGVKFLDFIQDYSLTAIITLLTYLRRSEVANFSEKEAYALYDKLIDNGYTLERIMFDVIYEALVVSGFLEPSQLDEIRQTKEEAKENKKQEVKKTLKEELAK